MAILSNCWKILKNFSHNSISSDRIEIVKVEEILGQSAANYFQD